MEGVENLRVYRGHKVKKGQRRIRKQRYKYQPNDIVLYQGKKWKVKGILNKGKSIKIIKGEKTEYPNPKNVDIYNYGKGFNFL